MLPEIQEEVRAWTDKAALDLRAAALDLGTDPPLIEDALFHCQQAAEKSMKGFLVFHQIRFRKSHDLNGLANSCESVDPSLREVFDPIRNYTVMAWLFRYPGEVAVPSKQDAETALKNSQMVYDRISSLIE